MKSMHKINIQLVALIAVAIIVSCSPNIKDMSYPESKKIEFSENLHGYEVEDSYRWLEDFTSEESVDWVEKQNAFTKKYNVTKLVYYEQFMSIEDAIVREKQLKAGSRQKKIDLILDKISKSGYDSLTKTEKETLFKAGKS